MGSFRLVDLMQMCFATFDLINSQITQITLNCRFERTLSRSVLSISTNPHPLSVLRRAGRDVDEACSHRFGRSGYGISPYRPLADMKVGSVSVFARKFHGATIIARTLLAHLPGQSAAVMELAACNFGNVNSRQTHAGFQRHRCREDPYVSLPHNSRFGAEEITILQSARSFVKIGNSMFKIAAPCALFYWYSRHMWRLLNRSS